jgi:hypothetical protein
MAYPAENVYGVLYGCLLVEPVYSCFAWNSKLDPTQQIGFVINIDQCDEYT